eukprot:gene25604-11256_t
MINDDGERTDNLNLASGGINSLLMNIDNTPGNWLIHCHISDHIGAGMVTWYNVLPRNNTEVFEPPLGVTLEERGGEIREYWIKANAVLMNYSAMTPPNLDYANYVEEYSACKVTLPGEVAPNGCVFWKGPTLKGEVGDEMVVHFMDDPFPQCTPGSPLCEGGLTCSVTCRVQIYSNGSLINVTDNQAIIADPLGTIVNESFYGPLGQANVFIGPGDAPKTYFPIYVGQDLMGSPKNFQLGPGSIYPLQNDDAVPNAFACVAVAADDLAVYACVKQHECDQYVYHWFIEERSVPIEEEGPCSLWAGHSHTDEITDVYAGLAFFILNCKNGSLIEEEYLSEGLPSTQSPFLQKLYNHDLTYTRTIVSKEIADREVYTFWQDTQEQGSALCALNGFANLLSGAKQCDNAFLVDYPTVNGFTYWMSFEANQTVLMGFFGMGSEPDYNSVMYDGLKTLPLDKLGSGQPLINSFPLNPGVTKLYKFDAGLIPLDYTDENGNPQAGEAKILIMSGASDFANRGEKFTMKFTEPVDDPTYEGPYLQDPADSLLDWDPVLPSKFYNLETRLKVHDLFENIALGDGGYPDFLNCDGLPIDEGVAGDNTEGETTIGSQYMMTWYTNGEETDTDGAVIKNLTQYGIVGPTIYAYPNHSFTVNLCNCDVPFNVTLKVGCGVVQTFPASPLVPYVEAGECQDFTFFVPDWLDPATALNGPQKTTLPCLYYSMPNEAFPYGKPSRWDNAQAPGPAQHTTGGLAGLKTTLPCLYYSMPNETFPYGEPSRWDNTEAPGPAQHTTGVLAGLVRPKGQGNNPNPRCTAASCCLDSCRAEVCAPRPLPGLNPGPANGLGPAILDPFKDSTLCTTLQCNANECCDGLCADCDIALNTCGPADGRVAAYDCPLGAARERGLNPADAATFVQKDPQCRPSQAYETACQPCKSYPCPLNACCASTQQLRRLQPAADMQASFNPLIASGYPTAAGLLSSDKGFVVGGNTDTGNVNVKRPVSFRNAEWEVMENKHLGRVELIKTELAEAVPRKAKVELTKAKKGNKYLKEEVK